MYCNGESLDDNPHWSKCNPYPFYSITEVSTTKLKQIIIIRSLLSVTCAIKDCGDKISAFAGCIITITWSKKNYLGAKEGFMK